MPRSDSDDSRVWTISGVLSWTREYFATNGIDSPRLSAELILVYCLGISRLDLYLRFDQPLSAEERKCIRLCIRRRIKREPLAHIVREQGFWTLDLLAGPEALIPRADTEVLVEEALKLLPLDKKAMVLDLGTGGACIALAIAKERPSALVLALDISLAASSLARKNIIKEGLDKNVLLLVSDWCSALKSRPVFDLLISNPPYIPEAHIQALAPEVRDFEPFLALDGGPDGLRAYRQLAFSAADVLKEGAYFLLEIGYDQALKVREIFKESGFYKFISLKQDLNGKDRLLIFQRL